MKGTGSERFELLRAGLDWILRGTISVIAEEIPTEVGYEVICDDLWRTRLANVLLREKSGERSLNVVVENGRWYANGRCNETISGCTDIDLEWSPSTNTLPIRRLNLAVSERSDPIIAAWVRFPNLELQPLSQVYERVSERRYRYVSNGGAFVAGLAVDPEGIVIDYEGLWQRQAANAQ